MFAKAHRLTTKDVRFIQNKRNLIWTKHFGFLRIPQYPNRRYHQLSLYIAAALVKKASRRHALKRQLLEHLQSQILPIQWTSQKYYKIFVFLNKQTITAWQFGSTVEERQRAISDLRAALMQEWSTVNQKLSLSR